MCCCACGKKQTTQCTTCGSALCYAFPPDNASVHGSHMGKVHRCGKCVLAEKSRKTKSVAATSQNTEKETTMGQFNTSTGLFHRFFILFKGSTKARVPIPQPIPVSSPFPAEALKKRKAPSQSVSEDDDGSFILYVNS
jgi:hypothetical protein